MKTGKITKGNKVKICWPQGSYTICTINHMPCGTGDLMHVTDDKGNDLAINTGSSDFIMMSRVKNV